MPGGAFLPDLSLLGHARLDVAVHLTSADRTAVDVILNTLDPDEREIEVKDLLKEARKAQASERRQGKMNDAKKQKEANTELAKLVDADRAMITTPARKIELDAFLSILDQLEAMAQSLRLKLPEGGDHMLSMIVIAAYAQDMKKIRLRDGGFKVTKTFTDHAIALITQVKKIWRETSMESNTLEDEVAIFAVLQFINDKFVPALLDMFPMITDDYPNWPSYARAPYPEPLSQSWPILIQEMKEVLKGMQALIQEKRGRLGGGMAPMES